MVARRLAEGFIFRMLKAFRFFEGEFNSRKMSLFLSKVQ